MFVVPPVLVGKRVMIVEDEVVMAMVIEDFLLECGCITAALCGTVATALDAVRTERFDLAVLDINLGGEAVFPVAHALAERGIPFLFTTGYGDEAVPSGRSDWKVCPKPFTGEDLIGLLAAVLDDAALPHAERAAAY